jgi:predicted small secreted protein
MSFFPPANNTQAMRTNPNNNSKTNGMPKRGDIFFRTCVLALAAAACLLVSGCETFRAWGEKSSSTPGTFGGSMSIPLGKK